MFHKNEKSNIDQPVQRKARVMRAAAKVTNVMPSHTDPQGSYTGHPMESEEKPVQDADDL